MGNIASKNCFLFQEKLLLKLLLKGLSIWFWTQKSLHLILSFTSGGLIQYFEKFGLILLQKIFMY